MLRQTFFHQRVKLSDLICCCVMFNFEASSFPAEIKEISQLT